MLKGFYVPRDVYNEGQVLMELVNDDNRLNCWTTNHLYHLPHQLFFASVKWILHHFPFHPWSKGHQDQFLLKRNIHNPRTSLTRFQYIDKMEHFYYDLYFMNCLCFSLNSSQTDGCMIEKAFGNSKVAISKTLLHFSRHFPHNDYHAGS